MKKYCSKREIYDMEYHRLCDYFNRKKSAKDNKLMCSNCKHWRRKEKNITQSKIIDNDEPCSNEEN